MQSVHLGVILVYERHRVHVKGWAFASEAIDWDWRTSNGIWGLLGDFICKTLINGNHHIHTYIYIICMYIILYYSLVWWWVIHDPRKHVGHSRSFCSFHPEPGRGFQRGSAASVENEQLFPSPMDGHQLPYVNGTPFSYIYIYIYIHISIYTYLYLCISNIQIVIYSL